MAGPLTAVLTSLIASLLEFHVPRSGKACDDEASALRKIGAPIGKRLIAGSRCLSGSAKPSLPAGVTR
jgi:hypothetical protein